MIQQSACKCESPGWCEVHRRDMRHHGGIEHSLCRNEPGYFAAFAKDAEQRSATPATPASSQSPATFVPPDDLARLATLLTPCGCKEGNREQQAVAARMLARWPKPEPTNGHWAVGVTTAPRPIGSPRPTLDSLAANGWRPTVFAEPGSVAAADDVRVNAERLGAWRNWRHAAETLLAESDAPRVLIVQDDAVILPGTRRFLDWRINTAWLRDEAGFVSLYTPSHYLTGKRPGLHRFDPPNNWAGQALLFHRDVLRRLLDHPTAVSWRGDPTRGYPLTDDPAEWKNIDTCVGRVVQALGRGCWFFSPSLTQHVAPASALGHGSDDGREGRRQAAKLVSDFRALHPPVWRPAYVVPGHARKIRVGVLYGSVSVGGAETWLHSLLSHLDRDRFRLAGIGVRVHNDRRPKLGGWPCEVTPDNRTVAFNSDALIAWGCDPKALADVRQRFPKLPVVYVSHNGDHANGVVMGRNLAPLATHHVGVSAYCRDALPPQFRAAAAVIPNGVPPLELPDRAEARRRLGIAEGTLAVAWVGRFVPEKDPLSAARCVAALPGSVAVYHGYASYGGEAEFRRRIRDAAAGRVIFRGPADPLAETWAAADAFVHCPQREGQGRVYLESWQAGVPVVSSLAGVVADHPDAAVIVPAEADGPTLAAAVREAVTGRCVALGRSLPAERYSAAAMAGAWGAMIERMASLNRP